MLPRNTYVTTHNSSDPNTQYKSKFKPSLSAQIARIRHHEKSIDRTVFISLNLNDTPIRTEPHKHE